jgi:hypothetical protein
VDGLLSEGAAEAESRATKDVDGLLSEGAEVGTLWFALSTSRSDLPDYVSLLMPSDLLKLMQPHCKHAHRFVIVLSPDLLLATLRSPSPILEPRGAGLV